MLAHEALYLERIVTLVEARVLRAGRAQRVEYHVHGLVAAGGEVLVALGGLDADDGGVWCVFLCADVRGPPSDSVLEEVGVEGVVCGVDVEVGGGRVVAVLEVVEEREAVFVDGVFGVGVAVECVDEGGGGEDWAVSGGVGDFAAAVEAGVGEDFEAGVAALRGCGQARGGCGRGDAGEGRLGEGRERGEWSEEAEVEADEEEEGEDGEVGQAAGGRGGLGRVRSVAARRPNHGERLGGDK
mmetsp:Transcript_31766/g.77766  ORF Transcript_31766/g.77766 Transcript_31766/m.77766 type:complete len:241 (+) Transcript_31766:743-1465(+)